MKHLSKRIAALAMALAMTLTLTTWASAADYADMPENWAKAPMEAAVEAGLLQGSDGLLRPTDHLTRAEMAAIVVRAFGATQSADVSKFSDVDANAWYVAQNAVPGAVFMQIMKGNANGTFEPGKYITREQAFAILARALKLEAGDAAALEKFSDAADVSSWATGEVAALAAAGYVNGSDGKLNPQGLITRQEFAQVMYNIFGSYIKEAGTYSEVGERTLMISADGVTIEDATIHGDVIIGEGVGEGDVYFKNVTIEGRVVIRGGGVNSIHFINSDTAKVLVSKIEGAVRVVTDKASSVAEVAVVAGQDTVTVEGSVDKVAVEAETPVVVKDAEVKTVEVKTDSAKVEITGASKVEAVSVTADAQVGITGSSNVTKVEAASGTVTAGGEARVSTITTTGGDVKVEDTARVTTIEAPKTEDGAPAPTVTIADTATVSTVKAETDVTLDGKANRVEAPKDVTVSDSNGNEVATTTPGSGSGSGTYVPSNPGGSGSGGNQGGDDTTKCPVTGCTCTDHTKCSTHAGGDTCSPTCTACQPETAPEEHTHSYTGTPTKVDNKSHKVACSCGDTKIENHDYTTGTDGACACGATQQTESLGEITKGDEVDESHEHEWEADTNTEGNVAASCLTDGKTNMKCKTCNATTVKTTPATGHTAAAQPEENITKAATCTQAGSKTVTVKCQTCSETISTSTVTIQATGHTLTNVEKVDATCTTDGKTAGQNCSNCDYKTGQDTIKAKGHTEVTDEAVAATCTTKGKTEGKHCSVCNTVLTEQTETETIPHNWVNGACSYGCNTECPNKSGHADILTTETCPTCKGPGEKEPEVEHQHTYSEWTSDGKGSHTRTCTSTTGTCNLTADSPELKGTCDETGTDGACSKCGYKKTTSTETPGGGGGGSDNSSK